MAARSTGCLATLALVLAQVGCASYPSAAQSRYTVRTACAAAANCFATIQAAVDAALRDRATGWVVIDVGPGRYHEKVTVLRAKTHLRGSGSERTILQFDAVAETSGQYHRNRWGTAGSATLTIDAEDVNVEGMSIENTYNFLANDALAENDPKKIVNSQAVALLLDIHSDRVFLQHAALIGYQDTLFANGKRALIRDSFISGNVDFIFGNGQLLIEASTVQSRRRTASFRAGELQSFIAAPSTQLSQPVGIVFYRSRLTREPGVPDGSVALARPWHPTTSFPDGRYADPNAVGQASFIDCYMDAHVSPDRWTSMNGTARDGSKSQVFLPQDSRFFESGSYGPGAHRVDSRIEWENPLGIDAVHREFFRDWAEFSRRRE